MLNQINEQINNCENCPKGTKELGWGTPGKILFVGQNPADSNKEGRRGDSNFDKFFLSWLKDAGITEEDFYFTNLIKVPGRDFTKQELIDGTQHLLKEIEAVQPTIIIGLGSLVRTWLSYAGVKFESMIHPAAARYGRVDQKFWVHRLKTILTNNNYYEQRSN